MFYVSRNLATFYNLREIRLIRISAKIFVQPAEFSKKKSESSRHKATIMDGKIMQRYGLNASARMLTN